MAEENYAEIMVAAMWIHEAWWGVPIGPALARVEPKAVGGPLRANVLDAIYRPNPLLQAIEQRERQKRAAKHRHRGRR